MATSYPDTYSMIFSLDKTKKNSGQYQQISSERYYPYQQIRLEKETFDGAYSQDYIRIRNHSDWNKCIKIRLNSTKIQDFYYGELPINGTKSFFVCHFFDDMIRIHITPLFCPFLHYDRENLINKLIEYFD